MFGFGFGFDITDDEITDALVMNVLDPHASGSVEEIDDDPFGALDDDSSEDEDDVRDDRREPAGQAQDEIEDQFGESGVLKARLFPKR